MTVGLLIPIAAIVVPLFMSSVMRRPRTRIHFTQVRAQCHQQKVLVVAVVAINPIVPGATMKPTAECTMWTDKNAIHLHLDEIKRDAVTASLPDYGLWFSGTTSLPVSPDMRVKVRIKVTASGRGKAVKTVRLLLDGKNLTL